MPRFSLFHDAQGYALKDNHRRQQALRIDFTSNKLQHRLQQGGKKELLLRAINAKPGLKVWDCTAGLGVDSFLMAARGCEVTMFERSPVVATLLEDALARAAQDASVASTIKNMSLCRLDALTALSGRVVSAGLPDVIYLDPMFPHRKKSARVKGDMQILQLLLGVDEDAEDLLLAAVSARCRRIVIKRPAQGGGFARPADIQFTAKSNRYDVYINAQYAL